MNAPVARSDAAAAARIETWTARDLESRVDEAMAIYVAAMHYPDHAGRARGRAMRGQLSYPAFAARAALDPNGVLLGFCYGYTSEPGQWWHDLVRRAISRPVARHWLDAAFELSELHVRPEAQGHGLGQALLTSLGPGLTQHAMLLSTPEGDTRAFRLYRRMGFVDLARKHLFPGDGRPFAVLGRALPFDGPPLPSA